MMDSTLVPAQHLNTDRFAIRGAVTAIRNAFMQASQQNLLVIGTAERRASARVRLQVPVSVTAAFVDLAEGVVQRGTTPSIDALSRDVSLGGLGLSHRAPWPAECAVVRFEVSGCEAIGLVVEPVWSHGTEDGTWTTGVRILGLTDPMDLSQS